VREDGGSIILEEMEDDDENMPKFKTSIISND
jgi:hypothetical protein